MLCRHCSTWVGKFQNVRYGYPYTDHLHCDSRELFSLPSTYHDIVVDKARFDERTVHIVNAHAYCRTEKLLLSPSQIIELRGRPPLVWFGINITQHRPSKRVARSGLVHTLSTHLYTQTLLWMCSLCSHIHPRYSIVITSESESYIKRRDLNATEQRPACSMRRGRHDAIPNDE